MLNPVNASYNYTDFLLIILHLHLLLNFIFSSGKRQNHLVCVCTQGTQKICKLETMFPKKISSVIPNTDNSHQTVTSEKFTGFQIYNAAFELPSKSNCEDHLSHLTL